MSTTATYTVSGMTCSHCVASVREEVGKVDGVTGVDVELATGTVTIESDGPVDRGRRPQPPPPPRRRRGGGPPRGERPARGPPRRRARLPPRRPRHHAGA